MILTPPDIELIDGWQHAADVSQQLVTDIANKAQDKADEALDAKRVHGGMGLDEYLVETGAR